MRSGVALPALALLTATLVPPAFADDAPLGRLFFTPAERQALEAHRADFVTDRTGSRLTVDGLVIGPGRHATTWIDGRPRRPGEDEGGIEARPLPGSTSRVAVRAGNRPPTTVAVGESVDLESGDRDDRLGGGKIAVRRPARR